MTSPRASESMSVPPDAVGPASNRDVTLALSGADLTELLEAVLARGLAFRFQACGSSMLPLIHDGDTLTIVPLGRRNVRLGEVLAVVQPVSDKLLVHRVVARRNDAVLTQGDGVLYPDGWIPVTRVLGRVSRVERYDHPVRLGLGCERLVIVLLDRYRLWPYVYALARLMRRPRA